MLAADFNFNDAHRQVIYKIETAYYLLLNAIGQEEAARANLANANAVQQAAESSLKNDFRRAKGDSDLVGGWSSCLCYHHHHGDGVCLCSISPGR
jgi:hypothetical protein